MRVSSNELFSTLKNKRLIFVTGRQGSSAGNLISKLTLIQFLQIYKQYKNESLSKIFRMTEFLVSATNQSKR